MKKYYRLKGSSRSAEGAPLDPGEMEDSRRGDPSERRVEARFEDELVGEALDPQVVLGGREERVLRDEPHDLAPDDRYAVALGFRADRLEDAEDRGLPEIQKVHRDLHDSAPL